jgi:hypothetical protein
MTIYKHLIYNPYQKGIRAVIQEAQDEGNLESGKEWCFLRTQPVTGFEWVAIFEKETPEYGEALPTSDVIENK